MSEIKEIKEINKLSRKEEQLEKKEKKLLEQLKKIREDKELIQKQKQTFSKDIKPRKQKPIQIKIKTKWGKEYVEVTRNNRLIEHTPKNPKYTIKDYRENYKTNNSLQMGVKKVKLTNVTEYQDSDLNLKNLKDKERFQYAYSVNYKGKQITARSTQFKKSETNKDFANKHALDNLKRKLSYLSNGVSDSDIGEKIIKDKNLQIRKSVIYYRKK
jgi:hypothetical protein